jgi:hypothetical protein
MRNTVGLSYLPVRLRRRAEFIPWNRFLGTINVYKYGLGCPSQFKGRLVFTSSKRFCVISSPTDVSPKEKSRMPRPLDNASPYDPYWGGGEIYNIYVSNQFQTVLFKRGGGGPVGVTNFTIG